MARRAQRKQRPQANGAARPPQTSGNTRTPQNGNARSSTTSSAGGASDRYDKYLPTWMRGGNGQAARVRPPRPRRQRPPRPAGGYTPGKFAMDGSDLR